MLIRFIKSALLLSLFFTGNTFAVESLDSLNLEEINISYPENTYLGDNFRVDISEIQSLLEESYSQWELTYEWDIFWESPQSGASLNIDFETSGKKQILLNIYNTIWEEKTLIYSSSFFPFIYKSSLPIIISSSKDDSVMNSFYGAAEDLWIYIHKIGEYDEQSLIWSSLLEEISRFRTTFKQTSDYTILWWEKEFLFSTISQIELSNTAKQKQNFVLVSWFNAKILQNYIANSIAWKNIIWEAFILDESSRQQILKNPSSISNLQVNLEKNNYEYIPLLQDIMVPPILFMSRFINDLSLAWVTNSDIYIILLLPIFLTLVAFSKHVIWFSTLGNIIPVFMWILLIKIWIIFTLCILWFIIVFNLLISRYISKYTLLYTPKITLITILNLVLFMLLFSAFWYISIVQIPFLWNILYIILFFIIAEKLISIMSTKEFREYKKSIWGTVIVSFLCYMVYSINIVWVFLLAYPELLLIFIPLNFFLWRFTWLRITEYIRFKDVSKGMEE